MSAWPSTTQLGLTHCSHCSALFVEGSPQGHALIPLPCACAAKKSSSAMAPTASSGGGAGRVCGGSKRAHIQLTIDVGAPAADDALITSVSPSGVTTRRAAQLASVQYAPYAPYTCIRLMVCTLIRPTASFNIHDCGMVKHCCAPCFDLQARLLRKSP